VDYLPVYRRNYLTLDEEQQEKESIDGIIKLIGSGYFYFSYDYDLTNSCQRFTEMVLRIEGSSRSLWPCELACDEFWWNKFLCLPFLHDLDRCKEFILPIICGFVGHSNSLVSYTQLCPNQTLRKDTLFNNIGTQDDEPSLSPDSSHSSLDTNVFLIARINRKRAGTRYNRRGIDLVGHTAIHVETELIVKTQARLASFVQIRGSCPLLWYQQTDMGYKPCITLDNTDNSKKPLERHIERLITDYYKPIVCINLLDKHGYEAELQETYQRHLNNYKSDYPDEIDSYSFDMNRKTKAGIPIRFTRVKNEILTETNKQANDIGWFVASYSTESSDVKSSMEVDYKWSNDDFSDESNEITILHILKKQKGVFRTNCLDCLDRTNIVQLLFNLRALLSMLVELGAPVGKVDDEDGSESQLKHILTKDGITKFKELSEVHGDSIASFYTGSGAFRSAQGGFLPLSVLKTKLRKAFVTSSRYYINRFCDGYRQDAIDLFLGYHRFTVETKVVHTEHEQTASTFHLIQFNNAF
jgi:phosphatidylinositol 4-phosphatase